MTSPKPRTTCLASPTSWRTTYCGSTRNAIAELGPDTCRNCVAARAADEQAANARGESRTR